MLMLLFSEYGVSIYGEKSNIIRRTGDEGPSKRFGVRAKPLKFCPAH